MSAVFVPFGGEGKSGGPSELNFPPPPIPIGETWLYDFNTNKWLNVEPGPRPSARYEHAMAYDSESDRVILFGGLTEDFTPSDETWAFDFNANMWMEVITAVGPRGRHSHAMAYDSESDRVILFGGLGEDFTPNDETWAYDFNTDNWTFMDPATSPSGPSDAMAYDAESDRIILFSDGETWAYDFNTNNWTKVNPGPGRSPFVGDSMTYDSESDRIILIDGGLGGTESGYPEETRTRTYDFNANVWTDVGPEPSPAAPSGDPAMAYDAESDEVLLFDSHGQTWAYDFNTNTWMNMDPAAGPSPRYAHAMAYDTESDRVILFGGAASIELRSDPWRVALAASLVIAGLATVLFLLIQGMRGRRNGQKDEEEALPTRNSGWIAIASLAITVVFLYLIPVVLVALVAFVVYAFSSWKVMSRRSWIVALAILILIFLVLPVLFPEIVFWFYY